MKYFCAALVLVIGEYGAALAFYLLKKGLGTSATGSSRKREMLKGILERLTMLVGLLAGFPHVLTAFGALKISTRLTEEMKDRISNTYFLAGNLISILFAMTYAWVVRVLLQ